MVQARSAALLMAGQSGGELAMNLLLLADSYCGGEPSLATVWVEVAGAPLVELAGRTGGELDIIAYTLDSAGAVVDRETRRLWIEPDRHSGPLLEQGLKVALRMRLAAAGESEVRVLAQWPGGPFGIRVSPLPAPAKAETTSPGSARWPLLVNQPIENWAVNRQPPPGRPEVPSIAGWLDDWVPAAKPLISGPTSVRLAVPESVADAPWVVRFVPRAGGAAIEVLLDEDPDHSNAETGELGPSLSGCRLLAASLDPGALPPGRYRLIAKVQSSAERPSSGPYLDAIVSNAAGGVFEVDSSILDEEVLLTDSTETTESTETETVVSEAEGSLRTRYREALFRDARAPDEQRGGALAAYEVAALSELGSLALLDQVEVRALAFLRRSGPKTALASALLHAETARSHERHRRIGLVHHSLRRALRLLDTVEADPSILSEALGSTGSWALRHGYLDEAREFLTTAVERTPNQGESQLLLAAIEEKAGRHQAVVRRLTQLAPEEDFEAMAEIRLRLAINLVRVRRTNRANPLFGTIVSGSGPEWIRQLAAQEQIRLLRSDDPDLAEAKVSQALAWWPDEPSFLLLSSELLEGEGRYEEAREILEPLVAAANTSPSPRSRYEQWPDVGRAPLGPQVRQTAAEQLSLLIERLSRKVE